MGQNTVIWIFIIINLALKTCTMSRWVAWKWNTCHTYESPRVKMRAFNLMVNDTVVHFKKINKNTIVKSKIFLFLTFDINIELS